MTVLQSNVTLKLISTSVLILGLAACGGGSGGDTTAPTVTNTTPADTATGIALSSGLTATFSEEMLATTLDESSFTLADAGSTNITGTVTFDDASNVVTFSPDNELVVLTSYTATLSTAITDASGNGLATNYSWSFTTEADTTAPIVTSTTPADTATAVAQSSTLTATFNEDVSASTVNASSFTLAGPGATNITGTVTFNDATNVATFSPDNELVVLTSYTATLSTAITDLSGNGLATNYNWSFTTVPDTTAPTVSSTTPANTATEVARNSDLTATFNEDVFATTVDTSSFTLADVGATNINGSVIFNEASNVATFSPDSTLAMLTSYTATLTTAITDLSGNGLATNYNWSFTTEDGNWGTAELIENFSTVAGAPQIAISASGNAVAVWVQHDGVRNNIWANHFDGSIWGGSALIGTEDANSASTPQVGIDANGNAIALWSKDSGTIHNIMSSRFDGSSWSTPAPIDNANVQNALSPQIIVDASGSALAVWYQSDGFNQNIWSSRFDGSTWATPLMIATNNAGSASDVYIASDSSNGDVLAVWSQFGGGRYDLWSSRFDGSNWSVAALIGTDSTGDAILPKVGFDASGNAVAVWLQHDGVRNNIWANRFDGSNWVMPELIETIDTGFAFSPQLAVSANGEALAVWTYNDGVFDNIYGNRFDGSSWGTAAPVETDDTSPARQAQVAIDDSGKGLAVWYQIEGTNFSVWSSRFDGSSWGASEVIETVPGGPAEVPQIAVDASGNALAVWRQHDGTVYNIMANRFGFPAAPPSL